MREIKFRGKALNRKDLWLYGDLRRKGEKVWIFPFDEEPAIDKHRVISETVGQFIGLKDKKNKECYFGDLVKLKGNEKVWQVMQDDFGIPVFVADEGRLVIEFKDYFLEFKRNDFEIIGNIYEKKSEVGE